MLSGRSQKELFKSNIIGVHDQCANTSKEHSFLGDVRRVLLREPCLKSLETGPRASNSDKKWEIRTCFRNLNESSFQSSAKEAVIYCIVKRGGNIGLAQLMQKKKTSHYYIFPFVALNQCKVQSLSNYTKTEYLQLQREGCII